MSSSAAATRNQAPSFSHSHYLKASERPDLPAFGAMTLDPVEHTHVSSGREHKPKICGSICHSCGREIDVRRTGRTTWEATHR
jgi:hypothetical protein